MCRKLAVFAALVTLACGDPNTYAPAGLGYVATLPAPLLPRPSRGSPLALSPDGTLLAALSPDTDSLSVIDPSALQVVARLALPAASMPVSLAWDPSGDVVWVALRKTGQVAQVAGLSRRAPVVGALVSVGSEPTSIGLSPTGRLAVVANFGETTVSLVDTRALTATPLEVGGNPRAVVVGTGARDAVARAYVTRFFGTPVKEGTDDGRQGAVVEIDLGARAVTRVDVLHPIATPAGRLAAIGPSACSPNQLYAAQLSGPWLFVAHLCASPDVPLAPFANVFSAVSVVDLSTGLEVPGASTTLVQLVALQGGPSQLLGNVVDLEAGADPSQLVLLSQGQNAVQPVTIQPGGTLALMPPSGPFGAGIPLSASASGCGYQGCPMPQPDGGFSVDPSGVPVAVAVASTGVGYALDWNGRSVIPFGVFNGFVSNPVAIDRMPAPGTPEGDRLLGRRFFYTAQGRWSLGSVSACVSCHPDGLSDGLTWIFPSGPRQTPGLNGTFAKGNPGDHRAQNWTALFDEVYDVEGALRSVEGGQGAISQGPPGMDVPLPLDVGVSVDGVAPATRNDGLSGSSKALEVAMSSVKDWEQVEAFVQRIPTPRAPTGLDPAAVARGRALFGTAGCANCHGGAKWTVSRVPYVPSAQQNGSLPGTNGLPAVSTGLRTELRDGGELPSNHDVWKVAPESLPNPDGGPSLTVGPERITCVLRDVGTFDGANPVERRSSGGRSQGALGYNPPSLLGLATSAPYLHHGQAATLSALFQPAFATHTQAGNPRFAPSPAEVDDLVAFLSSIDDATPPFDVPAGMDICGGY